MRLIGQTTQSPGPLIAAIVLLALGLLMFCAWR